jgi:modification methylase
LNELLAGKPAGDDDENLLQHRRRKLQLRDRWEFTQEMKNDHPAAFPVKLIDRIVASTDAKIILDPFMGSGTTAISAINYKRHFVGIDLSPEYCEMAKKRIKKHQSQIQLL